LTLKEYGGWEEKTKGQLMCDLIELRQRISELEASVIQLKRAEEALQLNESRLEALLRLSQMAQVPLQQVADFVLEEVVRLTKSKVGFLGFVDEDERVLTIHAWSKHAMEQCSVTDKPLHLPVDEAGLWAEAIRQRRRIIINDYSAPNPGKKGYPEGHVPLLRLMAIPVFEGDRIVAVAAVGNKEEEYDESDARQVTLLTNGMWRLVQRRRTEEESQWNYETQSVVNSLLRLSLEDIPLDELLERTLDLLLAIPWLAIESRGSIFLVQEDPKALVLKAQKGLEETLQRRCARLPFGRCLCGQAAATQEVQFADRLDHRHRIGYKGMAPHGHYCIPIVAAGRALGVLNLYVKDGHRRDQREEEFLIAIANTLAGIILRRQAEGALRRSSEETARGQRLLLALSQAAQAVQRARTPDQVYRTIGEEVTRLGYQAIAFSLTDDRERLDLSHLTFKPAPLQAAEKLSGLAAQDFRFAVRPGGSYDKVLTEGQAAFFQDVVELMAESLPGLARPLVTRIAAMLGLEQAICAPLTAGGDPHGLLIVTGSGLREADLPAMSAFAHQAAIAVENAQLYEAERVAREQLRDLASYLQTVREEERARIAREIHDEFGQALTALKIDLSWLTKRLPADKPSLAQKASAMSDVIDSTIQTVRRVVTELRPGLLDDLGLAAAIEWQAQEFAERTGMDCELHLGDKDIALDRDLGTAIFRIFQETLTNVVRHAEATVVGVRLKDRPEELALIVWDNGKGLTQSEISDPSSLGLVGMRERARTWGGQVVFEGVPGRGTTVTVRMPRAKGKERG
jgi:signal transduction histidine kinase/putative methionine-R-sulfoxide reductase with GAF domain